MKLRVLRLVALAAALLIVAGCASILREEPPTDGNQLPWNTPPNWEGQGIGLPY